MQGWLRLHARLVSRSENGISLQYEDSAVLTVVPGKFSAVVFDTEGRQCVSFSGSDELLISTTGMSAGLYILHVSKADGSTATAKFEVR